MPEPSPVSPRRRSVPVAWVLVGLAVVWNAVNLRAETVAVTYLNDSSVHEQMVRFATAQWQAGHLPLTSWFPYLGAGSPQFLHYQALPAMVTGLIGTIAGANVAFRWSLYLLLCLWPVSIYLGARLLRLDRGPAAAAALLSPLLMGATGVGYEQRAYLWTGYGVWTQLWASMTLPLAWGFSWRTIREGRHYFLSALTIALTLALHFETGYLALLPLVLWPLLAQKDFRTRVKRAAVLGGAALLASAWVIVPLWTERHWAATNEALRHSSLVNGYGAGRTLTWAITGRLLDSGRVPLITGLALGGIAIALVRWRRDERGRALVLALAGCLILSFGRTTWGALVSVVPGSGDLFFRRFEMGGQLAALMLAGIGAAWGVGWLRERLRVKAVLVAAGAVALLAPAWLQVRSYDRRNSTAIHAQAAADRVAGRQVNSLLALTAAHGAGRVFAGTASGWGSGFTVGAVPVFKYLESRDVDEIGYTLRTASLMTQPEYHFDTGNPADFSLFGIRYLVWPNGISPPVPADPVRCDGAYCLWTLPHNGYVRVGRIVGGIGADRSDVGERSVGVLRSRLTQRGCYLAVAWDRAEQTPATGCSSLALGQVGPQTVHVVGGVATAQVYLRRPAVTVLSASYDPGWTAAIDGRSAPVTMAAPALPAVHTPPGQHSVTFRYAGYRDYVLLFLVSGLTLGLTGLIELRRWRAAPQRNRSCSAGRINARAPGPSSGVT